MRHEIQTGKVARAILSWRLRWRVGVLAPVVFGAVASDVRVAYIGPHGPVTTLVVTDAQGDNSRTVATLQYEKSRSTFDGGLGAATAVSADGDSVAVVVHVEGGKSATLVVYPTAGVSPRTLLRATSIEQFCWSADSQFLVAETGTETGVPNRLLVINVRTGAARTISTGAVAEASFAPSGDQLAYGLGANLYVASATGAPGRQVTHFLKGSLSGRPVWDSKAIVFSHSPTNAVQALQLWSVGANGGPATQLTHASFSGQDGAVGLFPVAASVNGAHLVANFIDGQGLSHAREVDLSGATAVARAVPGLPAESTSLRAHDGISEGVMV